MSTQSQNANTQARELLAKLAIESGRPELAADLLRKDLPINVGLASNITEIALSEFLTVDKDMLTLKDKVRKLSSIDDPVLIVGESGTGKELIAKALHGGRKGPLVTINVTSLPDELIESELFGHVRGAFTGASYDKPGLLKYAHNGTVFLDEIGDMPVNAQSKLLRALQYKKIRPVGAIKEEDINCRIITATNKDPEQLVKDKLFRLDLYYRIAVITIYISSLRDRRDDARLIVKKLLDTDTVPLVIDKYVSTSIFSGNVRELQSKVRYYQIFNEI